MSELLGFLAGTAVGMAVLTAIQNRRGGVALPGLLAACALGMSVCGLIIWLGTR
jgi:hypothetical protein